MFSRISRRLPTETNSEHRIDGHASGTPHNENTRKRTAEDTVTGSEEPHQKCLRFDLNPKDESYDLPESLAEYIKQYMYVHIPDKTVKEKILLDNPVPKNIDAPPKVDLFIKDLLQENNMRRTLSLDQTLSNIQQGIHNIMGPLSTLWVAAEEEKAEILSAVDVSPEEKEKIKEMCNLFEQIVSLVGQASNKTVYYRRSYILESVVADSKRAKEILAENEEAFVKNDDTSDKGFLFGEKFEDKIAKLSKSKQKSKDVFTALNPTQKPFRQGPLPTRGGNRGRSNFRFSRFSSRGGQSRGKKHSLFDFFGETSSCVRVSLCPSINKDLISESVSSVASGRKDKILSEKLGKTDQRPNYSTNDRGLQNSISVNPCPRNSSEAHSNESGRPEPCRPGDKINATEKSDKGGRSVSRTVSELVIPSRKEGLKPEACDKSKNTKYLHPIRTFQDGRCVSFERNAPKGRFLMQARPERCLFFSAIACRITEICKVSVERDDVRIPLPVLRPSPCTQDFFKINESTHCIDKTAEWPSDNLFRRYSVDGIFKGRVDNSQGHFDIYTPESRILNKQQKICTSSMPKLRISGCRDRLQQNDFIPSRRESDKDKKPMLRSIKEKPCQVKGIVAISRKVSIGSSSSVTSPPPIQRDATSADSRIKSERLLRGNDIPKLGSKSRIKLVANQSRSLQWQKPNLLSSPDPNPIGCFNEGMGCSMQKPVHGGTLVQRGTIGAYKFVRAESSKAGNIDFRRVVQSQVHPFTNGQYGSPGLHCENGRDHKQSNDPNKQGNLGVSVKSRDHDYCRVPAGHNEYSGGQGVSETRSKRMDVEPKSISENLSVEGHSRDGPVCLQGVQADSSLLLLENGSLQQRDRCLLPGLDSDKGICIPSILANRQSIKKNRDGTGPHNINNTCLANSVMVSKACPNVYKKSSDGPSNPRPPSGSFRELPPISKKPIPKIGGLDIIRKNLIAEGVSEEAASLILQARRGSTRSHYESAWQQWDRWCNERQINPTGSSINYVLQFLTDLFKKGLEYNTIAGYRSAISAFHNICEGSSVGKHPKVSALMTGIFNANPPKPRYSFIWDVEKVLSLLNSFPTDTSINDKMLSYKLTMLLALASASRASEICHLDIKYLVKHQSGYSFSLSRPTKVQKPGNPIPNIKYFKFTESKSLCVCHTIDMYLDRSKSWRKGETQLLLSYVNPHNKVQTDTVSRWIKEVIALAGIDTSVFKAHSTRAASTSKASNSGVSLKEIVKRGYWSNESTFQKFYNKPTEKPETGLVFQATVINGFKERELK